MGLYCIPDGIYLHCVCVCNIATNVVLSVFFLFTVRGAKLKDWVLVLYGTDRDPQEKTKSRPKKDYDYTQFNKNIYDSTVYNSPVKNSQYFQAPETNKDVYISKYEPSYQPQNPYYYNSYNQRFYQPKETTTTTSTTTSTTSTTTTTTEPPFFAKSIYPSNRNVYPNSPYHDPFFQNHNFASKDHMCIFETLAKKKNMSALQYMRMVRENMTPGKKLQCIGMKLLFNSP